MTWFYLALLSPFLYAVTNLFDDNLLRYIYESPFVATSIAGIFGALPLLSLFFVHFGRINFYECVLMFTAGLFTATYLYFYFRGLQEDNPSVVIALFSLAPVTLPFFAYFLVHERLNLYEIIGFAIVLISCFFITAIDVKKFKFSKALTPILIAVVFINIISIETKYVYEHVKFYPAYMIFCLGFGIGGILFLILSAHKSKKELIKTKKAIKKFLPILFITEVVALSAEITVNLAISKGPVSIVKAMGSLQPIFVLLIALLCYPFAPKFFREAQATNNKRKLILMLVSVIGVGIIGISAR